MKGSKSSNEENLVEFPFKYVGKTKIKESFEVRCQAKSKPQLADPKTPWKRTRDAHCFTPTKRTHKILHQQAEGLHQKTDTTYRVWMENTADGMNYFAISETKS